MRYVNRRRLLIVMVLAALFGAVLPYIELILQPDSLSSAGQSIVRTVELSPVSGTRVHSLLVDTVTMSLGTEKLTPAHWALVRSECDDLMPENVLSLPRTRCAAITVAKIGWPFRAAHLCLYIDPESPSPAASTTLHVGDTGNRWLNEHSPLFLPKGILVWGALANIGICVLLFAGLYCGIATGIAHFRIKRGKCFKCGYLSNSAPVCPECGAAP